MALLRDKLEGVTTAIDLWEKRDGDRVKVAGAVICRQRPGTAKGFVFLSLEDETGIANVVITPPFFERHRLLITQEPFLAVTGRLQHIDHVIHVKAEHIEPLASDKLACAASHDFH